MMGLKRSKILEIKSYDTECRGFIVDIVTKHNLGSFKHLYEAWLSHENYGIKSFMFGAICDNKIEFIGLVVENLPECIKIYADEYMD